MPIELVTKYDLLRLAQALRVDAAMSDPAPVLMQRLMARAQWLTTYVQRAEAQLKTKEVPEGY